MHRLDLHWSYLAKIRSDGFYLTTGAAELLRLGVVYQMGRAKDLRPIIVVSFKRVDPKKVNYGEFCLAFIFVAVIVSRFMLVPGVLESWILVMDLCFLGISELDVTFVKNVVKICEDHFPGCLDYLFIYNASLSVRLFLKTIHSKDIFIFSTLFTYFLYSIFC